MPDELKKAVNQLVSRGWYASVSELIREGTRRIIETSPKLTINGFTEEFENEVLKAANEPVDKSMVWENEADIDNYFDNLKLKYKREK